MVKTCDQITSVRSNISSMRCSVSSPDETLRKEMKIQREGGGGGFLMNFEVFYLVIKHCAKCLISLLKQNDFRRRN